MSGVDEMLQNELLDRAENWESYQGKSPFWKGFFWPDFGLKFTSDKELLKCSVLERYSSVALIEVPFTPGEVDFEAAISLFPNASEALKFMRVALISGGYDMDKSAASKDAISQYDLISLLQLESTPARAGLLGQLADAASKLCLVGDNRIGGVVLAFTDTPPRIKFSVTLRPEEGGYSLLKKGVRIDAFDHVEYLPHLYPQRPCDVFNDDRITRFVKGRFVRLGGRNSKDAAAAVLADMAVQGISAARIEAKGESFVLADLDRISSMAEAEFLLHSKLGDAPVRLIEALPLEAPVHRFLVVEGVIVDDTALGIIEASDHSFVSIVKYCERSGPAEYTVRFERAGGTLKRLKNLAGKVALALREHRPHMAIDIELSENGPSLRAVHPLLSVGWYNADQNKVLQALKAHQEANPPDELLTAVVDIKSVNKQRQDDCDDPFDFGGL